VDGRCGQLLGHAASKGLPWVRAWSCSLLVWKGQGKVTELPGCDPFLDLKAQGDQRFLSLSEACDGLEALLLMGTDKDGGGGANRGGGHGSGGGNRNANSGGGGEELPCPPATDNAASVAAAAAAARMSVKDMKATLTWRGVNFSGCSERHELEELLVSTKGGREDYDDGGAQEQEVLSPLSGSDLDDVRFLAQFLRFLDRRIIAQASSSPSSSPSPSSSSFSATAAAPISSAARALVENKGRQNGGSSVGEIGTAMADRAGLEIGTLIPLHCGHNAAFSDGEKRMLEHHVARITATWTPSTEAGAEGNHASGPASLRGEPVLGV
jgi:hypothetical protein